MSNFMISEKFLTEAIVVIIFLVAIVIAVSIISSIISSEKTNFLIELAKEQLQAKHDGLSREHSSLSKEHDKLGTQIANENAQLKNSLTDIASHTKYLDEQKRVEMAMRLDECHIRIEYLESENSKLKQELMHGKNKKRNIDFEYDYDEDEEYEELVWEDEEEER